MLSNNKMVAAASGALENLFGISVNDKVLILTDTYSASIAQAFRQACSNKNCKVDLYKIQNDERPLKEIPSDLIKLLLGKTIVLNIIRAYPEEIAFRIKWIFKVEENKQIRMGHMPGITEEMMFNSVDVDFNEMEKTAGKLLYILEGAVTLHIKTERGTDILLGVKGRKFISDVGVKPGEMCNIPCGEIYCAPLESEAEGIVIFDASIGDIGVLSKPLKVFLSKGRITKFESEDQKLVKRITKLTNIDDDAMVIGELGIGVNPGARITGNMLEDEKALHTAHIAFGNNADFPGGGKNNSKIHRDFLFYKPTIEVHCDDKSSKLLMNKGKFIF